jgi:hypothetical protein
MPWNGHARPWLDSAAEKTTSHLQDLGSSWKSRNLSLTVNQDVVDFSVARCCKFRNHDGNFGFAYRLASVGTGIDRIITDMKVKS